MSDPSLPSPRDAAHGAVLGALIGDAAGAVLEFRSAVSPEDARFALSFPGGGVHRVAPGQITDDGELTLSLLRALVEAPAVATAEAPAHARDVVAGWYGRWLLSAPFDIGNATQAALGPARSGAPRVGLADAMIAAAKLHNHGSLANGALMRCTPLAVAAWRADDDALVAVAAMDAALTHPHPLVAAANASYLGAIASLIAHPGDRGAALARARRLAQRPGAPAELVAWLDAAEAGQPPTSPHIGYLGIAWQLAFLHLAANHSFETALAETLAHGGDTDTNACIVGGLLGAAVGVAALPDAWRDAITRAQPRYNRPTTLHPADAPGLIDALLDAPA